MTKKHIIEQSLASEAHVFAFGIGVLYGEYQSDAPPSYSANNSQTSNTSASCSVLNYRGCIGRSTDAPAFVFVPSYI